jgi:hypothetical protein
MRRIALLSCLLVIAAGVSGCGSAEHRVPGTITFNQPSPAEVAALLKAFPKVCPGHARRGCATPNVFLLRRTNPDPLHRLLAWLSHALSR